MKIAIWSEGYIVTGEHGEVHFEGEFEAPSFDTAVQLFLEKNPYLKAYHSFSNGSHRIWGCRLFDNEKDARKSFG